MKKFVCSVCGYVHEGTSPPETCPLCGVPADKFNEQPEAVCEMFEDGNAFQGLLHTI